MHKILTEVAGELTKESTQEEVTALIRKHISRRQFLVGTSVVGLSAASLCIFGCGGGSANAPRQVFVANALGLVSNDPTLCVGCRRCESACTGYNQGVAQPYAANVKVNRNMQFGVAGAALNGSNGSHDGNYGNFRVVQDTCKQCPHPVPCQLACPHGAIEVIPPVNARVIDLSKCAGCGICTQACPWAMPTLDGTVNAIGTKSHKCTLCNGNPECVQACVTGALTYTSWIDMTKSVPPRQAISGKIADAIAATCNDCH